MIARMKNMYCYLIYVTTTVTLAELLPCSLPMHTCHPCCLQEGQLVMGKVQSASGSGVWCWLANGAVATASLTELHDQYVPNALQGLKPGTFVRAAVAKLPSKAGKLKITLRQSRGCSHSGTCTLPQLISGRDMTHKSVITCLTESLDCWLCSSVNSRHIDYGACPWSQACTARSLVVDGG